MAEPSNSELMVELAALRLQMDRLVRHIPLLSRVADNADLKRVEVENNRRRKASAVRTALGKGHK